MQHAEHAACNVRWINIRVWFEREMEVGLDGECDAHIRDLPEGSVATPTNLFESKELYDDSAGVLNVGNHTVGTNKIGLVAWLVSMKIPERSAGIDGTHLQSRPFLAIWNHNYFSMTLWCPPNRRCGMHLLESIHKLKCNTGRASKGVTLMSQSETSGDPRESHPIIRPVVVFQCHCSILLRFILRCRFTRDWNRILSGFSIHRGAEKMMLVTMHWRLQDDSRRHPIVEPWKRWSRCWWILSCRYEGQSILLLLFVIFQNALLYLGWN